MHTCNRGPMLGARTPNHGYKTGRPRGWLTNELRVARFAEAELLAIDIADELTVDEVIARSAIEPREPRMYEDCAIEWGTEIEWDDWYAHFDDYEIDPFPWDSYADLLAGIEDEDNDDTIEGREPLDTDDLPGWGTHLDFEDLAGLTITNRPYGFSGYGQRDR